MLWQTIEPFGMVFLSLDEKLVMSCICAHLHCIGLLFGLFLEIRGCKD